MKKIKGIFGGGGSKSKGGSASAQGAKAGPSHSGHGYDVKEKELPKIHKAAWTGDIAKVKQLAKKDPAALDKEYRTPLHLACAQGHTKVVQELLEWNAKPNVGDSQGKTPLMKAVECNKEDCAELLLEKRPDLSARDKDGNTALHLAAQEGLTGMVAMLLRAGADVDLKNKLGQTPLILSVQNPSKKDDHTRLLLQNNADPNAVDNNQRSALHHACMEDGINHVKLLLLFNANTALKDVKGWTAEDCAMMKAHHACSQVVFDHNIKQRRSLSGSVPSTPRNTDSTSSIIRHTAPGDRDRSISSDVGYGLPQAHQDGDEDSDDQTVSKHSQHDGRQDSWADDTDISSADDKLKGAPKVSLAAYVRIDSDEGEEGVEDVVDGTNEKTDANRRRSPVKFRKVLVSTGKVQRPMYSRTPTPDGDLRKSPASPFSAGTPSKIPVKQSHSPNNHDDGELSDEDDSAPFQRNRVSFSDHQQVRNISATDDDTDIEDDEEEVEPTKKRRIETPEDKALTGGYTPTGAASSSDTKLTKESYKDENEEDEEHEDNAMLAELGVEEISDVSDPDLDDSDLKSPQEADMKQTSQHSTPRGILKKNEGAGKPPSVQNPVDTDLYWDSEDDDDIPDQERQIVVEAEVHPAAAHKFHQTPSDKEEDSDWDSTHHSGTDRGNHSVEVREEVESPEVDSDLEDTLNPEKSQVEKTSQWDSTQEEYTPRTPRDAGGFGNQGISPEVQEIEFDEEEDSNHDNRDKIHEAMTSFRARQEVDPSPGVMSLPTPEPQSDSSQLRSRDTPDPPTSSTSMQKTVIPAQVVEPDESPWQAEEDNSNWDSEDDVHSDEEAEGEEEQVMQNLVVGSHTMVDMVSPTVVGMDSVSNTPRTPRGQASSATDEESISEWEIERQKEKEQKDKEKQILEEMEEEEERQRQWEKEERRRQAELEREAQEELEKEKLADEEDESSVSEFSENALPDSARQHDSEHSHPSQNASQMSIHSEISSRSQRSEPRELKKLPPKLVVSKFISPSHSSRESKGTPVTLGEVENESPGPMLMYDDMIPAPDQDPYRLTSSNKKPEANAEDKDMYGDESQEEQEEESDDDIEEIDDEQAEIPDHYTNSFKDRPETESSADKYRSVKDTKAFFDKIGSENHFGDKEDRFSSSGKFETKVPFVKSSGFITQQFGDKDDEDEEDEFEDEDIEEMVRPETVKKVEAVSTAKPRAEFPGSSSVSQDNADLLSEPPPPLPKTAPPGKAMSLQSDGQSVEDEDLDSPRQSKPQGSSLLPDLSGTTGLYSSGLEVPFDDDGLSVTSTENGDISSSYRPENLPYGKDMLVSLNLNDSGAVLKLQEHLREHRKQLEYERNQKTLLESKYKQSAKDKNDLQKTIDSLKYQKSVLEQNKLDLEAKIRNLEYCMNDEEEKKKNAEMLLKKTKEQLAKKEEQYTSEMEAKNRAELAMRNVQMELRSAQNQIKDLEEEKVELERQLTNEKNARQLQEKINEEQLRLQQQLQNESLKSSAQKDEMDEANRSLELADDDIKQARDLVEKYKNEITALKAELQRQRTRLTEENNLLSSENEKLQQRVEDLRNEVKDHEEALTQLTVQQNLHNSKLASEATMLSNSVDKERVAREKLEAELESLRTRLQSTTSQLEKSQHARNDFERKLHIDREEWARLLDRKDQELTSLKEKLESHIHALNSAETKLNAVENELQISNTTLLERTNQYQQVQRDLQYYKTAQENHDSNYRHEKEQNAKLVGKIEALQDKLSSLQHENLTLKQQVETAQQLASDRAGHDLQDKLNNMIASLKADHEKAKASLEDRNANLQDTITRLREDVRNSENRRSNLEQDIRKLNQEQNELVRKLSIAEASLDVATKAREHLDQERLALKMEIEKLQQRYNSAQEKTIEAQQRMHELVERLDRTEQSRLMSTQQLADTSATMHAFNQSKSELEENYQKLQVENVRLDAELKHEKQKTEMLQRDLADSQKVRSSLEALCSNLKSTNAHLEEKLGPDQLREVTASIAQLERHKQETTNQLEEEKRKTRKALEQKKMAEMKLETEQERCQNLQKEVANLKAYLKVAKKRLKVLDTNENRLSNLNSAFDKERQAMEEMLVSVKSQLEHMKIQLQDEVEEKERMHHKNQQLENELKTIKKLEKSVQKIDRSKRKLEEEFRAYKNSVETGYTEKSTVVEMRKDIEARYRQELNRKLDEVNNYLEEQARTRQRLDLSREDQEAKVRNERKKLEEECTDLRIKYEQAVAKLEGKDMEAKRYRDLYESEMQWRMRLSEQLYRSTDKAFNFKNNAERQKNRMYGSLTNLSMNGHTLDLSKINGTLADDALSNRLRAELDRSIAKHLEAAPHEQFHPVIRADDPVLGSSNFAKASADYIEVLKRKYCV